MRALRARRVDVRDVRRQLQLRVPIGQNRQAAFQQEKADHDFAEEEQELKLNTQLTREVHALTRAMHDRILGDGAVEPHA